MGRGVYVRAVDFAGGRAGPALRAAGLGFAAFALATGFDGFLAAAFAACFLEPCFLPVFFMARTLYHVEVGQHRRARPA
jgi:hypothetical protein